MKKEILAFVLALLVLLGSLTFLSQWLTPKLRDYGTDWEAYREEKENSIDVMFFGSSIVYCDVVPAVFWERTGLTAYVNAGPEQTLPITLEYIRESLKTQSPQAIFVECTGVGFHEYQSYTKSNIGQMPWGLPRLRATFHSAEPELIGGLLFPLLFYHDRWETDETPEPPNQMAGYTDPGTNENADFTYETLSISQEDWTRNIEALKEICDLCKKQKIVLVLYRSPTERISQKDWTRLEEEFAGDAWLLDCLEEQDEIGAVFPEDWFDGLHYNHSGAEKFSRYLGDWTQTHLHLSPTPGQDTKLWQERLTRFRE